MSNTARIQFGYEAGGVRLTPIDRFVKIDKATEDLLILLFGLIDANDRQPGDGEIDIPVTPKVRERIGRILPTLGQFVPADANLFVRIRP